VTTRPVKPASSVVLDVIPAIPFAVAAGTACRIRDEYDGLGGAQDAYGTT
jgi:hypothetical protein